MAGYLDTLIKKPVTTTGYLGTLVKKGTSVDYRGTLGELSITPSFGMKTSTQAIPDETTPNIPGAIGGFAKEVGQSISRNIASFIGSEALAPVVEPITKRLASLERKSPFYKAFTESLAERLYGDITSPDVTELTGETRVEQIAPVGERTLVFEKKLEKKKEEYDKLLETPGLSSRERVVLETLSAVIGEQKTGLAPLIIGVYGGLDMTFFGGSTKTAARTAVAIRELGEARIFLQKLGVQDDLIETFAPEVVKVGTEKDASKLLSSIEKLQNTTKAVVPKTLDFLAEKAKELTADEFSTGFEAGLKAQNLTVRETAQNTLKVMRDAGFDTPSDFYRATKDLVAEKSRFATPEELLITMGKPKYGEQGLYLNRTEIKQLVDYMASLDIGLKGERGIVYKPYGFNAGNSKKTLDIILGETGLETSRLGGGKVVAEITKEGKLNGHFRIHATSLKSDEIVARLNQDQFLALGESTSPPTRPSQAPRVQDAAVVRPSVRTLPEKTPPQSGREPATIEPSQTLKEVEHIPEDIAKPFKQVVRIGAQTTKEPALYKRVTETLGKGFTNFIEFVQDTDIRVRKLLEIKGMKVTDATNPYQKATLYPGIVDTKIRNTKAHFETLVNDVVAIADQSGREVALIRKDINEYLHAVHAPERNAALGDGAAGMTNAQATEILKRINALPEAAEIQRVADDLRNLNREGLVLLRDVGVISDEFFDTLVTKYKNHVPLNRIFDEDEIQGALSIRGFDVRSTGIKRAKGSEREVADIWSNIKHNYEQAVLRSEKNIVDQATLGFVRENREALKGTMDVYKPRAIGRTFDGKIMMERSVDPQYLQLYENGKPIWIKIKDPALAVAMKGVGREKLPTLLHAVGAYTRFYAGLATRYALDFAFPNKLRDLQEMTIYMAAQKDIGFKGAAKAFTKDPASMKAVMEAIMGLDTPGARVYNEMKALGGTTGGMGLSTRKRAEIDLDKMFAIAQSKPRQAAQDVLQYIDNWNTIFEDSTRLTVYKQALAQGLSKERAAFLAKEASINFNRMGRGGPVINAIWMFSNASIQGSAKMIRSLKNPKVAVTVAVTVGTAVATMNQWNDTRDPDWRNKVTKWDRLNGVPIVLSSGDDKDFRYIVLPVSWGLKPIKVMADYAYDAASGRETDVSRLVSDFFTSVADAYNPLGGTGPVSAFTPTILDMPVEIYANKSWSGQKIRPDFDKNAPRDVQYFSNLNETALGEAFITTTKSLQENTGIALSPADMKYAFENLIGGAGKFGIKVGNVAVGATTDKPVPVDEYPFVSRFFRGRTEEEVGMGAGGDTQVLQNQLQNQSRERFYARQTAEDTYERMKKLPKEEASVQFKELIKTSPDIAEKVSDIAQQEKKGLNYTERLITQLGVANGERALYIYEKLKVMQSNDDMSALWQNYVTKGIITAQVADQISYLLKNKP